MTRDPAAISISVANSTIGGDVVAGDKIEIYNTEVHVHFDEKKLASPDAVYHALAEQLSQADASDRVIRELLQNPSLLTRLDAARRAGNADEVGRRLNETIREYERLGRSPAIVQNILDLIEKSRAVNDGVSFARAASAYLAITHGSLDDFGRNMALADEIVAISKRDSAVLGYVPVARISQARILYFQYTAGILELRTALGIRETLPVKLPLINLLRDYRKTFACLALADEYAKQALQLAFDRANSEVVIFVLFGLVAIQQHVHFHHKYTLAQDVHEVTERVRRIYRLLEQMIDGIGSTSDKAILYSNLATFLRQTGEYESAETLANLAAMQLSGLGDANGARRALEIAALARARTPVARQPSSEDFEKLSDEEVTLMMREASSRIAKLAGIDVDGLEFKEAYETAWRDFSPERVLRYCTQIEVDVETSDLGQALAMPTLGTKTITCLKFKRQIRSASLDGGMSTFKTVLGCEKCAFCSPRSPDWKWTMPRK